MEENRNLLLDYYGRKGVKVVDNLKAIPNAHFIDQHWTTEHYNDAGRKTIAKAVADVLVKEKK